MFITTLPQLLRLLVYAFLLGVSLGLLYDGFRIVKVAVLGTNSQRKTPKKKQSRRCRKKTGRSDPPDPTACKRRAKDLPPREGMPAEVTSAEVGPAEDRQKAHFRDLPGFFLHFFTDLLFFGVAAVVTVIFLYAFHRGKVRLSAITALAAGFFAYYCTVGKLVYSLAGWIVDTVRRAVRFALRFAYLHAILPVWKLLKRLFSALFSAIYRMALSKKRRLSSQKEEQRIVNLAKQGFGVEEERLLRL